MTENILFVILTSLVLFVSFVLFYFFRDNLKKVLIPCVIWVFFLFILTIFASLSLFNLPQGFIRITHFLLVIAFFIAIPVFFCLSFIVPVLLIIDLIKRHSEATSYLAWGALWMYLMLILSFLSYNKIRMNEFYKAGIAAQPLIQALENHKLRTKGYPKKLQDIFPEDLYSIHQTKIMGYPNLRYVPKNNSYKLILDCPIGILSPDFQYMSEKCAIQGNVTCLGEWRYVLMADSFEYWPGQNYPETIKRAQVVKLGKWVYIRRYD